MRGAEPPAEPPSGDLPSTHTPADLEPVGDRSPTPSSTGPPGWSTFSLEGRPAPGLYFVAWLLGLLALGMLVVGIFASATPARGVLVITGLVALGAALTTGAGYQVLARAGRPAGAYRGPSPLLVFGVVVALTLTVVPILGLLGLIDLASPSPFGSLLALSVIAVGYVAAVSTFVVRTGALTWRDMGWPARAQVRLAALLDDAATGIAVMVPAFIGIVILNGVLSTLLGVTPPETLPRARGGVDLLVNALSAVVVAPIGEELFFRGFALTAWQRDLGPRAALVRSSVFFALVHLANITSSTAREGLLLALIAFVVYLPLGALLGVLFQRRGIVASIAGHAAFNGTALILLALLSRFAGQA